MSFQGKTGIKVGQGMPFMLTLKSGPEEVKGTVTLKIKIRSKANPNFIKQIGQLSIPIGCLLKGSSPSEWFQLKAIRKSGGEQKAVFMENVGKLSLESSFIETGSETEAMEFDHPSQE